MKINQLEAKVQIKETELHEVREKYRVVCEDYEKLKEQNKSLLRRITNEQFERYFVPDQIDKCFDEWGGHILNDGTREIVVVLLVASCCELWGLRAINKRAYFPTDFESILPPLPTAIQHATEKTEGCKLQRVVDRFIPQAPD